MRIVTVDLGTHKYTEQWEQLRNVYCPNCGIRGVWHVADDDGDFYVGEQHMCLVCGATFYLPDGVSYGTSLDKQRLRQLRGDRIDPVTPKIP